MPIPNSALTKNLSPSPLSQPPSQDRVDALRTSIESDGILSPILVHRVGDGLVIAPGGGHARWLAARELALDIVPIREVRLNSLELVAMAQIENLERESIHPEETVGSLERLFDEFGADAAQIVNDHLPELQQWAKVKPALAARIKTLLGRCGTT